uniref:Uncharacterized protein n=1 Tax=Fagus sylvatica TaxID=28930 RepID=A0A2N9F1U4_FAGSY
MEELQEQQFKAVQNAGENAKNQPPTPKIQKVIFFLRDHWDFEKYFEPRLVSLGPIHHGKPKYQLGEKYKHVLTNKFMEGNSNTKEEVINKIKEKIEELRECFEEEVTKGYDDEALACLLFEDGCATLQFIYCATNDNFKELGMINDGVAFGYQDLFLLENQLPYRLLKWLMSLSDNKNELEKSIATFIEVHNMVPCKCKQQSKQQEAKGERGNGEEKLEDQRIILMEQEPIHLLDHLRSLMVNHDQQPVAKKDRRKVNDQESYHNVRELKAAGIHFRRSSNSCLSNIYFTRQYVLLGYLYLPPIVVDDSTRPKFLNLIAYEMCPDFENDLEVTSYISFLNSLIDDANDVKELRKAGIIHNILGSDEEVAQLFNEIGTELVPNLKINEDVKRDIQEHYETPMSWMFRFYHDHLGGTWSIAGFFGVILGLILSGVQAWFTVNPDSQRHN